MVVRLSSGPMLHLFKVMVENLRHFSVTMLGIISIYIFKREVCGELIVESVTGLSAWKCIHLESLEFRQDAQHWHQSCTSEQHSRTRRCIRDVMVTEKMVSSSSLSILPLPSWSNSLKYHLSFWLISPFNSRLIAAIYSTKSM